MKNSIAITLIVIIGVFGFTSGYSIGAKKAANQTAPAAAVSANQPASTAPAGGYGAPAAEPAAESAGTAAPAGGYGAASGGYGAPAAPANNSNVSTAAAPGYGQ